VRVFNQLIDGCQTPQFGMESRVLYLDSIKVSLKLGIVLVNVGDAGVLVPYDIRADHGLFNVFYELANTRDKRLWNFHGLVVSMLSKNKDFFYI